MPFYDRLIDVVARRSGYITKAESTAAVKAAEMAASRELLFAGEVESGSGYAGNLLSMDMSDEQLKRLALASAWVFSDVSVIVNEFSQGEMEVVEKKGEGLKAIYNHEFEQVLETPSSLEFMDASFLWGYSVTWGILRGEAYWLLVPNKAGDKIVEIIPIPSDRCWPEPDPKKYIKHFNYMPVSGGQSIPLPKERVMYWRRPNILNFHRGFSLFTPLATPLLTDASAKKWNKETFEKGLALQTILSLPSDLADPLFRQAKEDIKNALIEDQQRFLIARTGQIDPKAVGLTHRDAEFLSLRTMNRQEIDRLMGIPEGFWTEKANRATSQAARAALIDLTIWPMMVSFSRAVSAQVIRRYYGGNLRARFKDIRPVDRDLQLRERASYWRAYTLDEVREELGKKKFGGELGNSLFVLAISGKVGGGSPTGAPGAPGQAPATGKEKGEDIPGEKDGTMATGIEKVGESLVASVGKNGNGGGGGLADTLPGLDGDGGEGSELKAKRLRRNQPDLRLLQHLRGWQDAAVNVLRSGGHPAECKHETDSALPGWIKSEIMIGLWSAATEAEIKAVFQDHLEPPADPIRFVGQDDPLPDEVDFELGDEDLAAALPSFDEAMPEVAGLLNTVELKGE